MIGRNIVHDYSKRTYKIITVFIKLTQVLKVQFCSLLCSNRYCFMIKKPKHQETIPVRLNLSNLIQPQNKQSGIDTTPKKEEPKKNKITIKFVLTEDIVTHKHFEIHSLFPLRTIEKNINDLSWLRLVVFAVIVELVKYISSSLEG